MQLRELLTTWRIDVKDEGLKKIEGHLESVKNGMDFLVGEKVIGALIGIEKRFAAWAHELNAVSIASGVAVETIQTLTFAGAQFGATQEEITGAMTSLTLKINDAKMGVEGAQKAFAMAGFSGEQIRSFKDGNQALMALADRMHGTVDPIRRQAMAAQLGVSANSKLYAFLSQGSKAMREAGEEAKDLGIVMSKDQVKGLVDAQNAFQKLIMMIEGVGKTIAFYFAPSFKSAIEAILKFYKANKELIQINIKAWVYDITFAMGFLYGIIEIMVGAVIKFAKAHPELFRRITEVIGVLVAFGVALIAIKAILYPFKIALEGLAIIVKAWNAIVDIAVSAMSLWATVSGYLVAAFEGLISIIMTVAEAFGIALSPIEAGIAAIVIAIAAFVAAGVSLWQFFVQGKDWKDTWIGKMITGVTEFLGGTWEKFKKFTNFLGYGEEDSDETDKAKAAAAKVTTLNAVANVASVPSAVATAPAGMTSISTSTQQSTNTQENNSGGYSVNAPITINVKSGDPKEIGDHVQTGIKDHLDKLYRDTHRALKPAEHY